MTQDFCTVLYINKQYKSKKKKKLLQYKLADRLRACSFFQNGFNLHVLYYLLLKPMLHDAGIFMIHYKNQTEKLYPEL